MVEASHLIRFFTYNLLSKDLTSFLAPNFEHLSQVFYWSPRKSSEKNSPLLIPNKKEIGAKQSMRMTNWTSKDSHLKKVLHFVRNAACKILTIQSAMQIDMLVAALHDET